MSSIGHTLFDQIPSSFDDIDWQVVGLPVLAVDIEESVVDLIIKDDLIDNIGVNITKSKRLTAITNFEADIKLHNRCIVLFPFWTVIYRYQGGRYRVAVSGADCTVLAAMEPVFMNSRVWNWCKGVGAIIGAGLLCDIAVPLIYSDSDDIGEVLVAIFAGICFCAYVAWTTAARMTASIQVERIGEKEELVS